MPLDHNNANEKKIHMICDYVKLEMIEMMTP